jgi:uracil-DNA glycosylase
VVGKVNIVEDIKEILEFYGALGIEGLPINSEKTRLGKRKAPERLHGATPRQKEAVLARLRDEVGHCAKCKLFQKRTNVVFGEGNPHARLMFIGEAPGREEDLQARPFVGEAGILLTRLIEKMGFKREDVYIANVLKCRPPMNRDPEADEIVRCREYVEKQIEIIGPAVIMTLGRISAQTLIGDTKLRMTAIRGKQFDYKGIPLIPTFHPAYLLRNPRDKWLTWEDAQKVLERLKT